MKKSEQFIFVENIFTSNGKAEFSKKVTDAVNNIITRRIEAEINRQYYDEGEENLE